MFVKLNKKHIIDTEEGQFITGRGFTISKDGKFVISGTLSIGGEEFEAFIYGAIAEEDVRLVISNPSALFQVWWEYMRVQV